MSAESQIERPSRISPAVAVLVLFAVGIVLDRYFDLAWQFWLCIAVSGVVSWLICQIRTQGQSKTVLSCLTLSLFIVATGAFWHHGRWNWFSGNEVSSFCQDVAVPVCMRGQILGEPKMAAKPDGNIFDPLPRNERTIFSFAPSQVRNGVDWESVQGILTLVVHDRVTNVDFGDRVEVVGKLVPVEKPTSPGQFDFQNYSRASGQLAAIHVRNQEAVSVIAHVNSYSSSASLSRLRRYLDGLLHEHVGNGQAGFASAILLGNRQQLTNGQRDKFLVTGTAHLLAISGLHVGILASLFFMLYRVGLLNRRKALVLTIGFVLFYCWLVEFRPPVLRATVLLTLFCFGRLVGRTGGDFNLVALAGLIVLFMNPSDLFHLGPQLSFLAFATLIIFKDWIFPPLSQDPIERLIRNSRPWSVRWMSKFGGSCRQLVLVSALIWLIGLPLVAAKFHLVTPVATVVNPVVLLPMAIGLFSGLGVCVFAGVFPALADLCGWVCGKSLGLVSGAIEFASGVDGSHFWTAGPTVAGLVVFYLMLLLLVVLVRKLRERIIICGWVVLVMVAWMFPFQLDKYLQRNSPGDLTCTFVDVGHGSSVVVKAGDGRVMLYDAGCLTSARFASTTISNYLWSQGIEHLDAVLISHADLDHFNAIPTLVDRFSIGVVYVGFPMKESDSESVAEFFQRLQQANIPVRKLAWDDRVSLDDDSEMEILLPPEFGTGDSDNSNSVVVSLTTNGYRTLLPGDLERNGMQILLGQEPVDYDIVMMPHHGSKNSRPDDFLHWATPETAIICTSDSKLDGRVVATIEDQGCESISTARQGTIRVRYAKQQVEIAHWEDDRWRSMIR